MVNLVATIRMNGVNVFAWMEWNEWSIRPWLPSGYVNGQNEPFCYKNPLTKSKSVNHSLVNGENSMVATKLLNCWFGLIFPGVIRNRFGVTFRVVEKIRLSPPSLTEAPMLGCLLHPGDYTYTLKWFSNYFGFDYIYSLHCFRITNVKPAALFGAFCPQRGPGLWHRAMSRATMSHCPLAILWESFTFVIPGTPWKPPKPERLKVTEKWLKSDFRGFPQSDPQSDPKSDFSTRKRHFWVTWGATKSLLGSLLSELGEARKSLFIRHKKRTQT